MGTQQSERDQLFECVDCGKRVTGDPVDRLCDNCGGYMQNLSITRAE
jgi:Zn finger protein HypA/HybF involved in hydrogenase expression